MKGKEDAFGSEAERVLKESIVDLRKVDEFHKATFRDTQKEVLHITGQEDWAIKHNDIVLLSKTRAPDANGTYTDVHLFGIVCEFTSVPCA